MTEQFRFAAFISYSSKDAAFAKRLHRALERYGIPSRLGKFDLKVERGKTNRIYPVFRDREELSAGDLAGRIQEALQKSRSLIVICSPNAAASPWVEKEIDLFVGMGRREQIFAIIAPDVPLIDADGRDAMHLSFPHAFLRKAANGSSSEPIAADARPAKDGFRNAWLKIVAGVIGVNAGVLQDRDRRFRRFRFIRNAVGAFAAALILAAVWLTRDQWRPPAEHYLHFGRYAVAKGALPPAAQDGSFQDCKPASAFCPQMVVIPKGQFLMGSPESEVGRNSDEGPQHRVSVDRFAASKYPVTYAEWSACVADGGCRDNDGLPLVRQSKEARLPVTEVNWAYAQTYLKWLSKRTGQTYRLLTEAEWEYAARGVTTVDAPYKAYPWGNDIGSDNANCEGCRSTGKKPTPVGAYRPNAFGLYDMTGNVFQWVEDCYHETYDGAPETGFPAWSETDCQYRITRGGAWAIDAKYSRSAAREAEIGGFLKGSMSGFRVARSLSQR